MTLTLAALAFTVAVNVFLLSVRASRRRPRARPGLPPFEGPQIVGKPCAQCGVKIAIYFEAQWCTHCSLAVHNDCLAQHLAPREGPFR